MTEPVQSESAPRGAASNPDSQSHEAWRAQIAEKTLNPTLENTDFRLAYPGHSSQSLRQEVCISSEAFTYHVVYSLSIVYAIIVLFDYLQSAWESYFVLQMKSGVESGVDRAISTIQSTLILPSGWIAWGNWPRFSREKGNNYHYKLWLGAAMFLVLVYMAKHCLANP